MRMRENEASRQSFRQRIDVWAARIKVRPAQIRIQKMTRKWASCSTKGWVTFADDLINESKNFQDYVIVHELLHLRLANHGKLFKSLLAAYVPSAKHFQCLHIGDGDKSVLKRPDTR